jgi:hypothetical protein
MKPRPTYIREFYSRAPFDEFGLWKFSRKHFRMELFNHRFLKLNTESRARLGIKDLRFLGSKYAPLHLYTSVLDYLFPERVSSKERSTSSYPIGGEFIVDIDSYVYHRNHLHTLNNYSVCLDCLEISRRLAIQVCEEISRYYSKFAVVFSGRRGFHVHVLDFEARDWTRFVDPKNPLRSHASARFKFLKLISPSTYCFDRHHFIVSVDPLRIVSVPMSINGETGLICTFLGDRHDLEKRSVNSIVEESRSERYIFLNVAPIPAGEMR